MLNQCWCNVGPASKNLAQHYTNIGSTSLVYWEGCWRRCWVPRWWEWQASLGQSQVSGGLGSMCWSGERGRGLPGRTPHLLKNMGSTFSWHTKSLSTDWAVSPRGVSLTDCLAGDVTLCNVQDAPHLSRRRYLITPTEWNGSFQLIGPHREADCTI